MIMGNQKDMYNRSPLMFWLKRKNPRNILKYFTDVNTDINQVDSFGFTSFIFCKNIIQ